MRLRRYGRVYRGSYKGKPVAVKVVTDARHVRMVNGESLLRMAAGPARASVQAMGSSWVSKGLGVGRAGCFERVLNTLVAAEVL